ncbi:hypothetical protein [uncultured Thiodictyon sp.]|uniref:hypothetical protein n=1 Tax=uncultured Thiodictyon sp. TaxID=1846217 RepID=UPI0025F19464|nr:hypothetical protein [uncultured Thiodictyon sp.]
MPHPAPESLILPRPRAVLRLGFAGRRVLQPPEIETLTNALGQVLGHLGHRLAALTPGAPVQAGQEPRVSAFYDDDQRPLLRLITGLCEGADTVAAQVLENLHIAPDRPGPDGAANTCVETELAAVLPFDLLAYRASRARDFLPDFDRQAERCAYILVADGLHAKPDPDTPLAQRRRQRGYRAQSALLLRQADILIAAADPQAEGKAGGTRETVQGAMTFGLPVIFIDTRSGAVRVIEPDADIHAALDEPLPDETDPGPDLATRLADLVSWVMADPQLEPPVQTPGQTPAESPGLHLLHEYFGAKAVPPRRRDGLRRETWRGAVWAWLERRFRRGRAPKKDAELAPYVAYRRRATDLNYHFGGLYRGAFVLNYALAVLAVLLATLSLSLLAVFGGHGAPHWLEPALVGLGLAKLGILYFILRNTNQANDGNWNARAVDYRYLAERLRALYYLPLLGSFQPPAAARPWQAQRAQRQTAVDWLFDALLRSVSPFELTQPVPFPSHDGVGEIRVQLLALDPRPALDLVCEPWLSEQIAYHLRSTHTHEAMDRRAERAVTRINKAVLGFVALDCLILTVVLATPWLEAARLLPEHGLWHGLHGFTPWLLLLAAVLPAAVAALNGVRFQSEAARLGDRSQSLTQVLIGHRQEALALARRMERAAAQPAGDPGAWSLDTLRLGERVAQDCVREVAEWTVLYAKELPEP